tara:strand:- start:127 stop:471 length:345 start_codon:yes stop_codon:yes gene_type:complete
MANVGDKIKWKNADFKWNKAPTNITNTLSPYTWNDVKVIQEALAGADMTEQMPWTKWEKDDERRTNLVKLICKVQGKTITEEKEIKEYEITVKDINLTVKEVLGIEIMTENVKF